MTNGDLREKIRRILEETESATEEEKKEAARVYAARLRRLEDGVRRAIGRLNSEALSDADRIITDEKLLEDVASLVFADAGAWQQVCRMFDYDVAPTLDLGARDRLVAFQAEYEASRELFAKRRRQAMENAPPLAQLETLYRLEEQLGTRGFLTRQIEALERRRNDELAEAFHSVNEANVLSLDFDALAAEFRDSRRHTSVSKELQSKFNYWFEYAQSRHELAALRDLIARWRRATEEQDAAAVVAMLQEYQRAEYRRAADLVTLEETLALQELVEHGLRVERAEAMRSVARRKCDALRVALGRSSSDADKLYDLYMAAEVAANNAGLSIPADLEEEYRSVARALDTQRRRRRIAAIGFVLVVVAFFATLTTVSFLHGANVKNATSAATELQKYLAAIEKHDGKSSAALESAASFVLKNQETRPKFGDVPAYAAAVESFNKLYAEEKKRLEKIEELVDAIDDAHDAGRAATNLVADLKKLLYNDWEKERHGYLRLYQQDSSFRHAQNAADLNKYSELVDALTNKAKELQESRELTLNESREMLYELQTGIETLKSLEEKGGIAPAAVRSREVVEASFVGSERRVKLRAALEKHGDALANAVGDSGAYLMKLQAIKAEVVTDAATEGEFADAGGALGSALDAAIVDVGNVANAAAWNRVATSYPNVNASAKTQASADATTKAFGATGLAFAPEFKEFQDLRQDFEAFARRGGYANSVAMLLSALKKYSATTWTFYDANDERFYYLKSDPTIDKSALKYLADPESLATKGFAADNFNAEKVAASKPSLQRVIANKALETLKQPPEPSAWFEVVDFALRELETAEESTLDPALKLQLLAVFILSCESYPGFDELGAWIDRARKEFKFDFAVNAYQPSKELLEQRDVAKKALRVAPDIMEALAAVKTAFDGAERTLGRKYQWIGYLDEENSSPKLVVGTGKTAPADATLWIARGADATAEKIGVTTTTGATFATTRDLAQCRWTPVYLCVE